jgi:hypothetical protein
VSTLSPEDQRLVTLEVDGPIAVISNNRPEKHNGMSTRWTGSDQLGCAPRTSPTTPK